MIRRTTLLRLLPLPLLLAACLAAAQTQQATVRGRVEVEGQNDAAGNRGRSSDVPPTVVWLTAAPGSDVHLVPPPPLLEARTPA